MEDEMRRFLVSAVVIMVATVGAGFAPKAWANLPDCGNVGLDDMVYDGPIAVKPVRDGSKTFRYRFKGEGEKAQFGGWIRVTSRTTPDADYAEGQLYFVARNSGTYEVAGFNEKRASSCWESFSVDITGSGNASGGPCDRGTAVVRVRGERRIRTPLPARQTITVQPLAQAGTIGVPRVPGQPLDAATLLHAVEVGATAGANAAARAQVAMPSAPALTYNPPPAPAAPQVVVVNNQPPPVRESSSGCGTGCVLGIVGGGLAIIGAVVAATYAAELWGHREVRVRPPSEAAALRSDGKPGDQRAFNRALYFSPGRGVRVGAEAGGFTIRF